MKNISAIILALFTLVTVRAQYQVSTQPQTKHILLEEFTGVNCGNCPDGHRVAAALQTAQPEIMHLVSIHAGYFCPPSPEFKIDEGAEIDAYFAPEGYPSGMINRQRFGSASPVYYRSDWYALSRAESKETAPVNLWIEGRYEASSRVLTVNVEGYFTDDVDGGAYLSVILTQNDIKGPQSGGNMGNEYIHNHMLRAYLTPTWGEQITATAKGTYFSRQYTFDVPEVIGTVDVKPTDLEVMAFVMREKEDVLNVASAKPACSGLDLPLKVVTEPYKLPVQYNYGFSFIEFYLTNRSVVPVTSCEFEVDFNGSVSRIVWEGEIAAGEKSRVSIPVDWMSRLAQTNSFTLKCVAANGESVTDYGFSGSFGEAPVCSNQIKVQIKTDNFAASDNTFYLKDSDGNVVREFGPYPDNKVETYEEEVELEKGRDYCFEINDAWADGIYTPRGRFRLYDISTGSDVLVAQNLEITGHGYRTFFRTAAESGLGCLREPGADGVFTVYSLDGIPMGECRTPGELSGRLAPGVYILLSEDGRPSRHFVK